MAKKKEEVLLKEQVEALREQVKLLTIQVDELRKMIGKRRKKDKDVELSEENKAHQEAFSMVSKLAKEMKAAYMLGLKLKAKRKGEHPRDVFKSLNLKTCRMNKWNVNYEKLQLSYGTGEKVEIKSARMKEGKTVEVEYDMTKGESLERNDVLLYVFCEELIKGELFFTTPGEGRRECNIDEKWVGKKLRVYAFAYNKERGVYSETTQKEVLE